MIGMTMGINRVQEREIELAYQSEIPTGLLKDGIDDDGFTRSLIGEEVGIRRRLRVKKLPEDHV